MCGGRDGEGAGGGNDGAGGDGGCRVGGGADYSSADGDHKWRRWWRVELEG